MICAGTHCCQSSCMFFVISLLRWIYVADSVHPLVAITLVHLFDAYLCPLGVSHMHSDFFFFFLGVIGLSMKFRGASTCMCAENTWGRIIHLCLVHMIQTYRSLWTHSLVHRMWIIFHTKSRLCLLIFTIFSHFCLWAWGRRRKVLENVIKFSDILLRGNNEIM